MALPSKQCNDFKSGGEFTVKYHNANVVSVVQRQGSVHLQQVVLCPEKALQVLRVEAHHHRNIVQATKC